MYNTIEVKQCELIPFHLPHNALQMVSQYIRLLLKHEPSEFVLVYVRLSEKSCNIWFDHIPFSNVCICLTPYMLSVPLI